MYLCNRNIAVLESLISVFIKLPGKLHKRKYCVHFNYKSLGSEYLVCLQFDILLLGLRPEQQCVRLAGNFDMLSNFLYYFPF